ncbi:aminotransferase class III-fold pyridoxal phosphate-dependent enzyme (plasmid) [Leisingera sp. M527]|uniref:aminotransferase class III-fold pyridoxal phosphate-dependent enzyme n=1 Tax=Leisingera sp. M527 TaxID=2867014 RepID=UPI0021A8FF7B|nr:aminotransferase class III-fold pyridoxal phosphate-dependent enzyme [Leisingera sp. M527]UWQ35741.1 aminotransferase class III-fold pyridoxal phosphate-dependent enzyme [Leisingera sp. M527]
MPLEHFGHLNAPNPINPLLDRKLKTCGLYTQVVGANGNQLHCGDDKLVLDFVPGHGCLPLGHGPNPVAETVAETLKLPLTNLVQPYFSEATEVLARRLMSLSPIITERVNFATTGTEAIEIALNSARLATGRLRFIAAVNGTHGKSIGGLSVTHTDPVNEFAELAGTVFVPFGDIDAMDRALAAEGDSMAAVILEPVQSEGGVKLASKAYFEAVRALCDKHGVLLIHDEIMTGTGRTGHFFATEWTGGNPDIIVLGKALGGGVMPISACLLGPRAVTKSLDFQQMSSFAGSAYAATAANAMLDVLLENDSELLRSIRARSSTLDGIHQRLQRAYPGLIADTRGCGLLHGIEFRRQTNVVAGSEGAFLGLAGSSQQYPALTAGHMLSNGVRVTPAANCKGVLRIMPSYLTTDGECETYAAALEECLDALAAQDTVRATKHITGTAKAGERESAVEFLGADPVGDIGPDEGRFGFIVHQLETDDLQNLDPLLRQVTRSQRDVLTNLLGEFDEPILLSRARIKGKDGSSAVGDFILLPRSARQLLAMPQDDACELVQKCVNLAVKRGARIVGLGGYTSIVTRGGSRIDPLGQAVTTGNGFTIEAALMAADRATTTLGRSQSDATAAIIGAAGSIGSGMVQMISARARRLYLFVNPATPLEKSFLRLKRSLAAGLKASRDGELPARAGSVLDRAMKLMDGQTDPAALAEQLLRDPAYFVISDNCSRDLRNADIIYSATSSTDKLITPEDLRPQSVVCDLSRPGNISYRCREERDDVLIMDGGVIAYPGRPQLALGIPMPKGVAFACIAETVMLALRKHYENTSVGAAPSHREVSMLREIAAGTGFELADLRAFDKPIGRVDWGSLIGDGSPKAAGSDDALSQASAAADPRSLSSDDSIDYYHRMIGQRAEGISASDPAIKEMDGGIFTWKDLDHAAGVSAARFLTLGIDSGARVFVAGAGNFAHIAAVAGLWRIGAVPVTLDSSLPQDRLRAMMQVAAPMHALCSPGMEAGLADLLPVALLESNAQLLGQTAAGPQSTAASAGAEAVVIFTSGSTGLPKAVPHSFLDLVNMAENYGRHNVGLSPKDNVIVTSKLSYSYGFSVSMTALYHGAALLLGNGRFDPAAILDQIEQQKATVLFSVPTVYSILVKQPPRDLSTLRQCIAAGEARSPFVDDAWEQISGISIQDGLGATEIMSFALATPKGEPGGRSIGTIVPGFSIEIRNAHGQVTRTGEAGVAWVRGNSVATGYLGNPDASAQAFQDGWYRTDDIMRMDGDGRFHYLGRATDLTKVGGVWVSPAETQNFLNAHPLVAECAVVLREHPEPLVRPYAFVVPAAGATAGPGLEQTLKAAISEMFAKSQVPHKIFFLDALPRTGNGKVQRFALSDMVQDKINLESIRLQ